MLLISHLVLRSVAGALHIRIHNHALLRLLTALSEPVHGHRIVSAHLIAVCEALSEVLAVARRDALTTLLLGLSVHEAAAARRLALPVRRLMVLLHGRGCFLIQRQLLRAIFEEVHARVRTLVSLEVDHVVGLLEVALVSAALNLSPHVASHVLRVAHLVGCLAGLASIVRAAVTIVLASARHVVARVRCLTLEHVV